MFSDIFRVFSVVLGVAACFIACAQNPIPNSPLDEKPSPLRVEARGIKGGFESIPKYSAILWFENTSDAPCVVSKYTLRWDGGEREINAKEPFVISEKSGLERSVALGDPITGSISQEDAEARLKTLTVEAACDAAATP